MLRLETRETIPRWMLFNRSDGEKLLFVPTPSICGEAKIDSIFLTITWNNKELFSVLLDQARMSIGKWQILFLDNHHEPLRLQTRTVLSGLVRRKTRRKSYAYLIHWPLISTLINHSLVEIINYLCFHSPFLVLTSDSFQQGKVLGDKNGFCFGE